MRYILLISFLVMGRASVGQTVVPQRINYQAVARNAAGMALVNQSLSVKMEILEEDQQTILYAETHAVTTNAFGLFTLAIGGGTALQGSFSHIAWGKGGKFIRTSADLSGGANYQLMGTSQLLSVPYALFALKADSAQLADDYTRRALKRQATLQYLKY